MGTLAIVVAGHWELKHVNRDYRVILSEMVRVKTSMVSNSADFFVVCLSYDDIIFNIEIIIFNK